MGIRRAVPNILSDDLDAAREFYAGFLGFDVAMDEEGFMMFSRISIEVDDVDAVHADAVRRGLEVVYPLTDEPWGIRRFFVRDPDGTVVNVATHIT
jgi:catechol 2,3-dioxygenase-like lactoylglutathione lyase family enzyme